MGFKIGDKVVALVKMETFGADGQVVTRDAFPGFVGHIISTNVYNNPDYYTADFRESGGHITDCNAIEIAHIH